MVRGIRRQMQRVKRSRFHVMKLTLIDFDITSVHVTPFIIVRHHLYSQPSEFRFRLSSQYSGKLRKLTLTSRCSFEGCPGLRSFRSRLIIQVQVSSSNCLVMMYVRQSCQKASHGHAVMSLLLQHDQLVVRSASSRSWADSQVSLIFNMAHGILENFQHDWYGSGNLGKPSDCVT